MGLSAVSRTAVGVARIRAAESQRPDRLFDDPLAAAFVDALGDDSAPRDVEISPQRRALAFHVIVRTRYFDDYLTAAVGGGIRQVVLLAAGLDARAFRLPWPDGTRLFELDLMPMVDAKEQVLRDVGAERTCDRVAVAVDLAGEWLTVLEAAGWDPARPTAWLAEGLLVYLDAAVAEQVLAQVSRASAPGSRLSMERASHRAGARLSAADTARVTRLWRGGLAEAPEAWLRDRGWDVRVDNLAEVAASYGRPIDRVTDSGFLTATLEVTRRCA